MDSYKHPAADLALRPEMGAQPQLKKQAYRYDSSLSHSMERDGLNPARAATETHITRISELGLQVADLALKLSERDVEIKQLKAELKAAQSALRKVSGTFLNYSGKAERLSFEVSTLPLFVHERLSTKAIVETLKGHRKDAAGDIAGDHRQIAVEVIDPHGNKLLALRKLETAGGNRK